jgi:hypothetical protein
VATLASWLLSLWVGKKPTKRTVEMFSLFCAGWATEAELLAHINKLHTQNENTSYSLFHMTLHPFIGPVRLIDVVVCRQDEPCT